MTKKLSTEEFVERAQNVHGDTYDYSFVCYVNNITKVSILCKSHGKFIQRPSDHLQGQGCPKCGKMRSKLALTTTHDEFIESARRVHGTKYDYSMIRYVSTTKKVDILCHIHGPFSQTPSNHINNKTGCPQCSFQNLRKLNRHSLTKLKDKLKEIHKEKYQYLNLDEYTNNRTVLEINCPHHGKFKQQAQVHLRGGGCKKCSNERNRVKVGRYCSDWFESHPEYKDIPAKIYLIELQDDKLDEHILKIGITTRKSVYERYRCVKTFNKYQFRVIVEKSMPLYEAYVLEQLIKKGFKQFKKQPSRLFDGYTECIAYAPEHREEIGRMLCEQK